jgi:thiol-disulfide isomerase/thioredoxin
MVVALGACASVAKDSPSGDEPPPAETTRPIARYDAAPASIVTGDDWTQVYDTTSLSTLVEAAVSEKQAFLLVFTAAWCVPCRDIERNVLMRPAVRAQLDALRKAWVDLTDNEADAEFLLDLMCGGTLPCVLAFERGDGLMAWLAPRGDTMNASLAPPDDRPMPKPTVTVDSVPSAPALATWLLDRRR